LEIELDTNDVVEIEVSCAKFGETLASQILFWTCVGVFVIAFTYFIAWLYHTHYKSKKSAV